MYRQSVPDGMIEISCRPSVYALQVHTMQASSEAVQASRRGMQGGRYFMRWEAPKMGLL
jgi:hypothetical protein